MNRHLSILGTPPREPPAALSPDETPPLRATELGAFRYGSKLEMRIARKAGRAIATFELIEPGDRVMVCCSGGKDSYALLDALLLFQRSAPFEFSLFAVNLDQGWPKYDVDAIARHLRTRAVEHHMLAASIAPIVEAKLRPEQTPCSLCSRLRRGALYGFAQRLGATKIALGHHLDDFAETLLLNLFYSGQLKAMPPKLRADDGRNVVIRPFAFVEEKDLVAYAQEQRYPTVRCSCPTCGLPDQKRQVVKRLLTSLQAENPGLKTQMLAAMSNVKAGHLLDRALLAALGMGGGARESDERGGMGMVAGGDALAGDAAVEGSERQP